MSMCLCVCTHVHFIVHNSICAYAEISREQNSNMLIIEYKKEKRRKKKREKMFTVSQPVCITQDYTNDNTIPSQVTNNSGRNLSCFCLPKNKELKFGKKNNYMHNLQCICCWCSKLHLCDQLMGCCDACAVTNTHV